MVTKQQPETRLKVEGLLKPDNRDMVRGEALTLSANNQ